MAGKSTREGKLMFTMLALALLFVNVEARKFSACQVASQLLKHGVQRHELSKWVCIVMGESGGNTRAINPHNVDKSTDYGFFQINNRYWCGEKGPSGGCKVACKSLLDDNISDDMKCARIVEKAQGLDAWVAWKQKCKNGGFNRWNIKPC